MGTTGTNLKTAIYIRVSTHFQIDKDSLQVQRRELIAYSEMILGIKEYEVFEDPGFSGKNTDRPAYQNMMSRFRSGEFSHLLVWKIDRISRNLLDFAEMYRELKALGVTFVSKNEQFDTSTAIGEAMLKIILVFAELERNMTAERVTSVMLSRANNGQWNGGRIPFGYNHSKETGFTVNHDEARIYLEICDLYEKYQSTLFIARNLTDRGILTRAGLAWTPTAVHKILSNVFYLGTYRYNVHSPGNKGQKKKQDEWIDVPDHHVALIDKPRFDRIQAILKRNVRGGRRAGNTIMRKYRHIFSGLLVCGYCGGNLAATSDRLRSDGWRPSMYLCRTKRNSAKCPNKYVTDVSLGPFILALLSNMLQANEAITASSANSDLEKILLSGEAMCRVQSIDEASLTSIRERIITDSVSFEYNVPAPTAIATSERQELESRIRKSETALTRLQNLYLYGSDSLPEKDYILEHKRITDEMEKAKKRLGELNADSEYAERLEEDFVAKASYFLMIEKLMEGTKVVYTDLLRTLDPDIIKTFLNVVLQRITVKDGVATCVEFRNGLIINFNY